jgi:hypothetical protein
MESRRIMATLAGAVTAFFTGFLCYGIILASFFAANGGSAMGAVREQPLIWALAVGNLVLAVLLVAIFARTPAIRGFADGLQAGAMIGFLMALAFDLVLFATSNLMNLTAALVDPLVFAVVTAVTGGVIAAVGRFGQVASSKG